MMMTETLWTIISVVGPILLVLALIWAIMRNRKATVSELESDHAAHRLNDEIDREDSADEVRR